MAHSAGTVRSASTAHARAIRRTASVVARRTSAFATRTRCNAASPAYRVALAMPEWIAFLASAATAQPIAWAAAAPGRLAGLRRRIGAAMMAGAALPAARRGRINAWEAANAVASRVHRAR